VGKHEINAFLGTGTSFTGRLAFTGVVRIDGAFDGEIASSGTLVIGENARVSGRIDVGKLVCGGEVSAAVTATASVAVHAKGRLVGSLRTPALIVDEGGRIDGEVSMGEASTGETPAALVEGNGDACV